VWLVPWWMLAPDSPSSRSKVEAATGVSLRAFLTTPIAWGLAASVFFYSYYWYFFLSWIPTYLVLKHDMPNVRMGMTMAAPLAGMALVNLCSGALADRISRGRGDAIRVRKIFVSIGFASASFLAVLAWVDKGGPVLPVLLASLMGVGIAAGNYWALSQTAAPRDLVGRALGFQNMIAQIAGAAAPLLTGLILGPEQDFGTGIVIAGICPLISVAAILILVKQPRTSFAGAAASVRSKSAVS
jgi:MFS transporter, ACS family, D-galactonate transporter